MIGLGDSQDRYRGVVELCTDALMVADVEANILRGSRRPDMGGIVADPVHIYQLFSNLITNALRYCDSISDYQS
jgi:signal transduction histidine kinase